MWAVRIELLGHRFDESLTELIRRYEPRLFPNHHADKHQDHDEQRNLNVLVGHRLIGGLRLIGH